jgi:hypothetical protein
VTKIVLCFLGELKHIVRLIQKQLYHTNKRYDTFFSDIFNFTICSYIVLLISHNVDHSYCTQFLINVDHSCSMLSSHIVIFICKHVYAVHVKYLGILLNSVYNCNIFFSYSFVQLVNPLN